MVLGHIKASGAKELAGSVSNFGLFTGKKKKQTVYHIYNRDTVYQLL